ncbi:MAG TPA: hypothetical protein VJ455_01690 [Ignavibacteria bacterium]|nr:hypothetical protein [Ignavibacteria bacterium]
MKKTSIARLSGIIIILISVNIYSQYTLDPDSIKTGVSYKFILYDDTEVIGKVTAQDSLYIKVAGEGGTYRLKKEDIFFISKNLVKNKFHTILSVGGGLSFLSTEDGSNPSEYKPEYSLQLTSLIPIGENKGIRIDAGYSKWKRDEYTYSYSNNNDYQKYGSRTKESFSLKGDFVYGMIAPENKFWIYGTAGFGMVYLIEGPSYYSSSWYNSYDSTYQYNSHNYEAEKYTSAVLSLGCSFGYRFSKNFGIYADVQYNLLTYRSYFFFFWGGGSGYIPVRAGITYIIN